MPEKLPKILPLFPLAGHILVPGCVLPLHIFEPRYRDMTQDALEGEPYIGIIQPRTVSDGEDPELFSIGGVGKITQSQKLPDDRYLISLTGVSRFRIESEIPKGETRYRRAHVSYEGFQTDGIDKNVICDRDKLLSLLTARLSESPFSVDSEALSTKPTCDLINELSQSLHFAAEEKQMLLEAENTENRGMKLMALLEMSYANQCDVSNEIH